MAIEILNSVLPSILDGKTQYWIEVIDIGLVKEHTRVQRFNPGYICTSFDKGKTCIHGNKHVTLTLQINQNVLLGQTCLI